MKRFVAGRGSSYFKLAMLAFFVSASLVSVYGDSANTTAARLLNDLKYLASDELEGRGVGTEGLNQAADFIRDSFANAGLDVSRVESDAFQKLTMVTNAELGSPNELKFVGPEGREIELAYDEDFRSCSFGGSGAFEGELVFCGYGIDSPDDEYQEFANVDVKDKVVLIIRRVPQQGNPHGPFAGTNRRLTRHAELRTKVSNAVRHGAAAILFVNDTYTVQKRADEDEKVLAKANERVVAAAEEFDAVDPADASMLAESREKLARAVQELKVARRDTENAVHDVLMDFGYGGKVNQRSTPILHITQAACNQLLGSALHTTLEHLETAIDDDLKPHSAELTGWKAVGETSLSLIRSEVKNVIGVLEGEGPLADETIIIGAHYDHLGRGGSGSLLPGSQEVHNGADDNASGTTALLELARRFGSREQKLPRRLVFIAFTAEERGLIGSEHYVKEPIFPLEKTIAMFNMDMVGRLKDDRLTIFGTGTAPRWSGLVEKLAEQQGFKLSMKPDGYGPSDQSSFYGKEIPVLHFFTGTHSDYHRPSDDWDKINFEGMTRVTDMIEAIVTETALEADRPQYVKVERKTTAPRGGSRPYFGSIPDFGTESEGYSISGVSAGSPADRGGLRGGDSIVQLGDQKIESLDDFDLALRRLSPGDEVEVVVLRDGQRVNLKVTLAKPK